MPEPPPSDQQLDFEFLQAMIVIEELALAQMYLFPDKDIPVSLAHRIWLLRTIEAGDSESLGGEFVAAGSWLWPWLRQLDYRIDPPPPMAPPRPNSRKNGV
jgi:hypothetical protein